ncbi:MAG: hypothetical protein J6T10_09855, partial [Methanobrevibacter sp.]|nr:hypothetical protein [Methanobrevibacter sp.]
NQEGVIRMTPICETIDRLILMLDFAIMFEKNPKMVEEAKQDKANLELLRKHLFRKEDGE